MHSGLGSFDEIEIQSPESKFKIYELSKSSNFKLRTPNYFITPNDFPIFVNAATAFSKCAGS